MSRDISEINRILCYEIWQNFHFWWFRKIFSLPAARELLINLFTRLLLVHSHSAHLLDTFFDIGGAISKFVAVLVCMYITRGESDVRDVGINKVQNELLKLGPHYAWYVFLMLDA